MNEREMLTGWKEIEAYIGLKSEAIRCLGFPVRKKNGTVMVGKRALARYLDRIVTGHDVACMMELLKLAREANRHRLDNLVDATACIALAADMESHGQQD